jgi:hypothetical protein
VASQEGLIADSQNPPDIMLTYSDIEPNRIKHMEMIQAVVARLGGNGFLVKGWAITLAAALSGFALNSANSWLAVSGLVSTLFFWSLDTYFLRSERLFRALFDQVRVGDESVAPFLMGATGEAFATRVREGKTNSSKTVASWIATARRPTLLIFYLLLLLTSALVIVLTCTESGRNNRRTEPVKSEAATSLTNPAGNLR